MRAIEIIEPGGPEVVRFVDVLARRGVPGYSTGWPFVPGMEVGGTIHGLGEGLTITGFSILNRARKAPPKALSPIQGVLTLIEDGLHIPAPAVVDWTEAIDAHIAQSQGRRRGKTVVRL